MYNKITFLCLYVKKVGQAFYMEVSYLPDDFFVGCGEFFKSWAALWYSGCLTVTS